MHKTDGQIFLSASDVAAFLECPHATTLELLNLETPLEKAEDDDQARLIQEKGLAHEAAYFAHLGASGLHVMDLSANSSVESRAADTQDAMRSGPDVIFQGTLKRGRLFGHPDFLRKVPLVSNLGSHSYVVVDTKLARAAKSKFLLQLAFYSDLLATAQGRFPDTMQVALGDGREQPYRVADYDKYVSHVTERLLHRVSDPGIDTYPIPCAHCTLCRWRNICGERWRADDHLSQVAGITAVQTQRLETAGVRTMGNLAALSEDASIPRMSGETLGKLRGQANLQVAYRNSGERQLDVLDDGRLAMRGFARLPKPDPHDLFFDIEGDPLVDGGLEYLLGLHWREDGGNRFRSFWGHDRGQERASFEQFMDFVSAWLAQHPAANIYHYAAYEESALRRLMCLHGTREAEVDRILRQERLVDLYKVVRGAVRISEPGYSLKNIEHFYMPARDGAVQSAGASIVVYERWKECQEASLLNQIESYNRDDLRSTMLLRDWLVSLRPGTASWMGEHAAKPDEAAVVTGPSEVEQRLDRYRNALLHALPATREDWGDGDRLRELVFQLLDFHRREAKPIWWAVFSRMDLDEADLVEDVESIGGMTLDGPAQDDKKSRLYTYAFPEQDLKLKEGSQVRRCDNAAPAGTIARLDEDARRLTLRIGAKAPPLPAHLSIGPSGPIASDAMKEALFRAADALVAGDDKYAAVFELLLKRLPRLSGRTEGEPVLTSDTAVVEQSIDAVAALDRSYLFIQGPPGAGKTFTASHIIVELLRRGYRVGVASNSHKAIHNLLHKVEERASQVGHNFRGLKKASSGNDDSHYEGPFVQSVHANADVFQSDAQLVAGTAWLFSDPGLDQQLDYLFIDEAGQVALANVVAMATSARNVVLLGDQMQLGQPTQAIHPGRSGDSSLDYLLDGLPTIPEERGIFLPDTWRMHPDVCRFISDAVYEGRLRSAPGTERQRLALSPDAHPDLRPTGIRFIGVTHDGCSQRSEEEASVVDGLYKSLLGQRWVDMLDQSRPVTPDDILVVAPYNLQVNLLKKVLPGNARVGTVDKFQGQEAAVVLISMATSSGDFLPRNIEFLYSRNRLNVAISRARCLTMVVVSPALLAVRCTTPEQMALVNTLCWVHQYSRAKS